MLGCLNLFVPAHGKKELISVLWHENLLHTWISDASNPFISSKSTKISFPDASAHNAHQRKMHGNTF